MANTVDEYIRRHEDSIAVILMRMRKLIKETVPEVEEGMGNNMPRYKSHGRVLLYFAATNKHMGVYAMYAAEAFRDKLTAYKTGKGSIQFPYDREIPWEVIREIILFRWEENKFIAEEKRSKK